MNAPASPAAVAPAKPAGQFGFHPRAELERWPGNPRQHFDETKLGELARSLASGHGMIEPIVARPHPKHAGKLEIAAGERRWRAAGIAKLELVPVIVRPLNDQQMLELATIENAQREDLHPLEQADGYERLIKEFQYTPEKIADAIGKSRAHVFQIRKLRSLAPKLRDAFLAGEMDTTLATVVARVPTAELQLAAWSKLKQQYRDGFSFRVAADFIRKNFMLDLMRAPFNINDATLVEKAGSCTACPKRTGNQADLFPDVRNGNVCTDPGCFQEKRAAAQAKEVKTLEAKGVTVIAGEAAKRILPHEWSRLNDRAGFADKGERCWEDGKGRTYGQLAKEANVEPVKIQNPHTGALHDAVPVTALKGALQTAGIKLAGRIGAARDDRAAAARNAKQKATEERNRLESQARSAILAAVHDKVEPGHIGRPKLLALVLDAIWQALWHEYRKKLAQLWQWNKQAIGGSIMAKLQKLDAVRLSRMLVDAALIDETPVAAYRDKGARRLAAFAKLYQVDADKIRARIKAEARARKAAKAKPKAKAKPAGKGRVQNRSSSAYLKPLTPSPALAAIVGAAPISRVDVTKKVWSYIKRHGLQDKKERRFINADAKLLPIFQGKKRLSMFEMIQRLSAQFAPAKKGGRK